jgi:glycosyltransferase involved in cell wall biosynthesis
MRGQGLRIAQVAPLYESVPPQLYGGTERVVSYLTEELVREGHEVTLFASGDSSTSARLVATCPRSLRLDSKCMDRLAPHLMMLEQVIRRAREFDVIHFHVDYLHLPFVRRCRTPHLSTMHGRLDIPELKPLFREYPEARLLSISNAQRAPLPFVHWQGTVYHGLPRQLLRPGPGDGGYLAFLGRISPEKGPERAIAIARACGIPLKLAAKVDRADAAYFERVVRPLLEPGVAELVGEIDEREKQEFLGKAMGLLFPIDWPEPFGLVMIEAMACGTPVLAFRRGSVPEIVEDGVTGLLVDSVEEAALAIDRLRALDRRACRAAFERRFTAARMARDYAAAFRELIGLGETRERLRG